MTQIMQNMPMLRNTRKTTRRVVIVTFPGVQTLDVTGPAEVFAATARVLGKSVYQVVIASRQGGLVETSAGFSLTTRALHTLRIGAHDTVLVAGGDETCIKRAV